MKRGQIPRRGVLMRFVYKLWEFTRVVNHIYPALRPFTDQSLVFMSALRKLYIKLVVGLLVGTALEFYDFAGMFK